MAAGLGTFTSHGVCTLSSGQCSLAWQTFDDTVGSVTISANYAGSSVCIHSSGWTSVSVSGRG
ncbi:MAG: hypothetical protein L3K13_01205 [Thermoplasmata archaeon]|nr:hypothetical protein [Thermoplasmata archaeon]